MHSVMDKEAPRKMLSLDFKIHPLVPNNLDALLLIESCSYSHPWTRTNFMDSFAAGYLMQGLFKTGPLCEDLELVGYYVAMKGVDEYHLLNLTVSPSFQRRGLAKCMLNVLQNAAKLAHLNWIWLEVRESNRTAIALYTAYGFNKTGERKNYYPYGKLGSSQRENAVLMSFKI